MIMSGIQKLVQKPLPPLKNKIVEYQSVTSLKKGSWWQKCYTDSKVEINKTDNQRFRRAVHNPLSPLRVQWVTSLDSFFCVQERDSNPLFFSLIYGVIYWYSNISIKYIIREEIDKSLSAHGRWSFRLSVPKVSFLHRKVLPMPWSKLLPNFFHLIY